MLIIQIWKNIIEGSDWNLRNSSLLDKSTSRGAVTILVTEIIFHNTIFKVLRTFVTYFFMD